MFTHLANTDNEILWAIPSGKPNPHELFPGVGKQDERSRVDAKGQKNETCTYYAFNFFRPRVGKHPDSDPELRRIERLFSAHRKMHTQMLNKYDKEKTLGLQILQKMVTGDLNPDSYSEEVKQLMRNFQADPRSKGIQLSIWITENHHKALVKLNEPLLKNLAFDLDNYCQQLLGGETYASLSIEEKVQISSLAITFARLEKYPNLAILDWTAEKGPESLMQAIRQSGPMLARGFYGREYYKEDDLMVLKDKIAEQTIFGWKPKTHMDWVEGLPSHSVVVAGVKKSAGGKYFILFIDPRDASPANEPRKLYLISYESFINNMVSINGCPPHVNPSLGENTLIRQTGLGF